MGFIQVLDLLTNISAFPGSPPCPRSSKHNLLLTAWECSASNIHCVELQSPKPRFVRSRAQNSSKPELGRGSSSGQGLLSPHLSLGMFGLFISFFIFICLLSQAEH